MNYSIEVYDTWRRRIAAYDDVPRLEVRRRAPDHPDEIHGLLPARLSDIGPGYTLRVLVEGRLFAECPVTRVAPAWGDVQKLILERYVSFHELLEVSAAEDKRALNRTVPRAYVNREISAIVRDVINAAPGPIHYYVDHDAYPDGAQREFEKFDARKRLDNELETGGIETGDWVGATRIDATSAYAKDGDTIAGLVVDGAAWPDVRLIMIDCEETSRNSHAITRHPELAFWTDAEYSASGYKLRADAAKAFLQQLLDTKGIDYIELNPHKDAAGAYDDRVDAFGRYLALVFAGGECFNAALVEAGHADVYLYQEGRYHDPALALKEFYSYVGAHQDSIAYTGRTLTELDVQSGALEVLAMLAYAAGGFVFEADVHQGVVFHKSEMPQRVAYHNPRELAVTLGSQRAGLANALRLLGNPFSSTLQKTYARGESIDTYGLAVKEFEYFAVSRERDADLIAEGVLDDLAYPEPSGMLVFFNGDSEIEVGQVIEVRGAPLRRYEPELEDEWQGRFTGKLVGRAKEVRHLFSGKDVTTVALLTSPLRSVSDPLLFMVRTQKPATTLFGFRLDDDAVGLDMGFHID